MEESFRLRHVNQLTGVFMLFIIGGLLLFSRSESFNALNLLRCSTMKTVACSGMAHHIH